MDTVCFDQVHLCFLSLIRVLTTIFLTCALSFKKKKNTKTYSAHLVLSYMHRCRTIYWSISSFSKVINLNKITTPSPKPSITYSFSVRDETSGLHAWPCAGFTYADRAVVSSHGHRPYHAHQTLL